MAWGVEFIEVTRVSAEFELLRQENAIRYKYIFLGRASLSVWEDTEWREFVSDARTAAKLMEILKEVDDAWTLRRFIFALKFWAQGYKRGLNQ